MKFCSFFLGLVFISCGNDFRPKEEEIFPPEAPRERTGDGIYPDTVITETEGCKRIEIYHDHHSKEVRDFFESGAKQSINFYVDNRFDSICTYWYESGIKQTEVHYRNGQRHGRLITWYDDGTIERDEIYENDEMTTGERVAMDEDLMIDYVEILENGVVIGIDSSLRGQPAEVWWSQEKPLEK